MKRSLAVMLVALVALGAMALPATAAPGGTPGSPIVPDAIYADGELFGTILLGDLPYNGNDNSFNKLFMPDSDQPAVAFAAHGPGYKGGRWLPVPVTWVSEPYLLTSYADIVAAEAAGDVVIGEPDTDAAFLCPLIKGPRS